MDNNFWFYIILIPIIINIISNALYDFFKPRIARWKSQSSIATAQMIVEEVSEQIEEVTNYKNDHELLVKVALREILRAFWSVFVAGIAAVVYITVQFFASSLAEMNAIPADTLHGILLSFNGGFTGFLLRHFEKSLKRVLLYYRMVRDTIDYDNFLKRKTSEMDYFKQTIKKLSKTRRSQKE
jgi:hypothetical protein